MFGKTEKIVLCVEGMMCNHCAMRVTNALKAEKGVKKVEIDLENKKVYVEVSQGAVAAEKLAKAVTEAGYPARAENA